MKHLPVILIIAFIIITTMVGIAAVNNYIDTMSATWQAEKILENTQKLREMELEIERKKEYTEWYKTNATRLYTGLMLILFLFLLLIAWFVYNKRMEAWNRQIDGSYALQWKTVGGGLFGLNGVRVLLNPDKLATGMGALTVENVLKASPDFADDRKQLQFLEAQGRKQLAQAMDTSSIKYAAHAKLLAGTYDKTPRIEEYKLLEEKEEEYTETIEQIPLSTAIAESGKFDWYVGQYADSNSLAEFNFTKKPHVLVCGGTNCGKTSSTGYLLALYALKSKMHVVVFDGAGGADWQPFYNHVEFYEAYPEHLEMIVEQIGQLYMQRQTILKQNGVADNYTQDKPMQPIIIIIDELGYLLDGLKAKDKKLYKYVVDKFQALFRVVRKVGIHLVVIDQNANTIPQEILTNIKCIFAYRAEGLIGNAIKRYNLDKLKEQGQFDYQGKFVDAWYTKQFLNDFLPQCKPVRENVFSVVTSNGDNEMIGRDLSIIDVKSTPSVVTSKSGNTPVTSDKTSDNRVVTSGNKVVTAFSLNRAAVTEKEKEEVYRIYLENGKKKNQTCKVIWGKAGGYLKYLDAVIAEYEGDE